MISLIEKKLNQINLKKIDENLPQAVLILIVENDKDYSIVFTEDQKDYLLCRRGLISWRKKENEDKNLIETALRETRRNWN